jgi:hypothetical protein
MCKGMGIFRSFARYMWLDAGVTMKVDEGVGKLVWGWRKLAFSWYGSVWVSKWTLDVEVDVTIYISCFSR